MKIITNQAILHAYDMAEVVESIENVYRDLHEKMIIVPERIITPTVDGGDYLYGAATNLKRETYIVVGSGYHPWNAGTDKLFISGAYLFFNFRSGETLAVVNGEKIVDFRTGAKSAVACKYLARKDSKTLGLIGLGAQAKTQAEAIATQFRLKRILGFSRDAHKSKPAEDYILNKTGLKVERVSMEETIRSADILVVGTHSKETLIRYANLQPGQLVIGLAHSTEVDPDVVQNANTFVDYLPSAINEDAPVKMAVENGFSADKLAGELSQLVAGEVKGRVDNEEIIFFQSLGVVHENMATVEYLYDKLAESAPEVSLEA